MLFPVILFSIREYAVKNPKNIKSIQKIIINDIVKARKKHRVFLFLSSFI